MAKIKNRCYICGETGYCKEKHGWILCKDHALDLVVQDEYVELKKL